MEDDLSAAILASAQRLRVNPVDLATAVSYETAGTFDPWKKGPTTQWGQHRGLIQWGEPQRQKYGVYQGMSNTDQMKAVERYLTDAGVQPNMGLLDIYSAINAGKVKRYNASDANNGGAWGTVADKVNHQMDGHRAKAEQLLAGKFVPTQPAPGPQPNLANLYAQAPATPGMPTPDVNPLAVADASPLGLGALFRQQQVDRRKARQEEADAEVTRKAALFGGSLYG